MCDVPKICSKSRGESTSRPIIEDENPKREGKEEIVNILHDKENDQWRESLIDMQTFRQIDR